jgi:preprotein translocase subunit YajC
MVPPSGEGGGFDPMSFLPLVAIVAIFYFLVLRPQSKRNRETQSMLSALKKGDRVVTVGGVHGGIQTVRETALIVKVDDNTKLEINRTAIASVTSQAREDKEDRKLDEKSTETSGNE